MEVWPRPGEGEEVGDVATSEAGLGCLDVDAFEDESGSVGPAEVVELEPYHAPPLGTKPEWRFAQLSQSPCVRELLRRDTFTDVVDGGDPPLYP